MLVLINNCKSNRNNYYVLKYQTCTIFFIFHLIVNKYRKLVVVWKKILFYSYQIKLREARYIGATVKIIVTVNSSPADKIRANPKILKKMCCCIMKHLFVFVVPKRLHEPRTNDKCFGVVNEMDQRLIGRLFL